MAPRGEKKYKMQGKRTTLLRAPPPTQFSTKRHFKVSNCSSVVSGNLEGRNQTSHRNHLRPPSCHSGYGSPCYYTSNQTIHLPEGGKTQFF
ncbi:hypothetical protein COP2_008497 [Malus domestica]